MTSHSAAPSRLDLKPATADEPPTVIELENVSKIYKLFGSRQEQVLESTGLSKFLPKSRRPKFGEFHALHDISLKIQSGERVGIIGRNGAGKTTLLRLITENFAPTSGKLSINGSVQALMQLGLGYHPEFTGHENIVASLNYNGLIGEEFKKALQEVIEFVELGDFLHQPVKSYSLGMQARLQFASATAIRPDILIVDEVLGAGDAYFAAKSAHRMKKLATSGCTLLLVSHATAEVLRFCERVIWIHQGAVLMDGPALDVIRVYEAYIEELNFKMREKTAALWAEVDKGGAKDAKSGPVLKLVEKPTDDSEAADEPADAKEEPEAPVEDASDKEIRPAAPSKAAAPATASPKATESAPGRTKPAAKPKAPKPQEASWRPESDDSIDENTVSAGTELPDWQRDLFSEMLEAPEMSALEGLERWPGESGLKIRGVRILDTENKLTDRITSGAPATFETIIEAEHDGTFQYRLSILFMSLAGVGVCRCFSPYYEHDLKEGQLIRMRLHFPEVQLTGNEYVFSAALFKHFDMVNGESAIRYDLLSRAFRLRVDGRLGHDPGLFHHPCDWAAAPVRSREKSSVSAAE